MDPAAVPPSEISLAEEGSTDPVIADSEDDACSLPDSDASEDRCASCEVASNDVIIPAAEGFASPADTDMAGNSGSWTTVSRKRPTSSVPVSVKRTQQALSKSAAVPPKSDIHNGDPSVLCEVPKMAGCSVDHRAIVWEIVVDYRKPPSQRKTYGQWTSDPRFIGLRDKDIEAALAFCNKKFPS